MPDNPTLSERLRRLQNTACYCDGACGKHPALDCLLPEILQALDDNERLTKRVARLELDLECELGVRHMTVDRLEGLVEGMPTHEGNFLQRIDELRELESDNARYRATIVQLEKERKEAVERVAELEMALGGLIVASELHRIQPTLDNQVALMSARDAAEAQMRP